MSDSESLRSHQNGWSQICKILDGRTLHDKLSQIALAFFETILTAYILDFKFVKIIYSYLVEI